jgi:hypothetical protein
MDPQPSSEKPEKQSIGGDLIIPVAALLFTLYYFSTILNSPWTAQVSAFFIGTILILLVVIFFVKSAFAVKSGEADLRLDRLVEPRSFMPKRLALVALTIAYVYLIQWGGFTLTSFAFLSLAMLLLSGGRNKRFIFVLSAVLALTGYLIFILAFETRFPDGPFELLMERVL